jgi:hypothetical protein
MKVDDTVQFIIQNEGNKGSWIVTETKGAWAKLLGFYDDTYGYEEFVIQGNLEVIDENR